MLRPSSVDFLKMVEDDVNLANIQFSNTRKLYETYPMIKNTKSNIKDKREKKDSQSETFVY